MDSRMFELISNKPELVTEFPDWMLSKETETELLDTGGLAIVEIAGRDSYAAALEAIKLRDIKAYLPTIAYSGTQFGDWETSFKKAVLLKEKLSHAGIKVFDPLLIGDPKFWRLLCGRYAAHVSKQTGFHSSCLGCHLYFHGIRIPLAKMLNCNLIVAGERESHEGKVKINQLPIALDTYISFVKKFDIELLLPLRQISSNKVIEAILGEDWEEGTQQLQCVLSGNYEDPNGDPVYSEEPIKLFYEDYALPLAEDFVQAYLPNVIN